jgi:hypothetical protein
MRAGAILAFLALTATAVAFDAPGGRSSAQPVTTAAEGGFELSNSREGEAIFEAAGIAPGDSVAGTVEIANVGAAGAGLLLDQGGVANVPGAGGGTLSSRLTVRVRDVTAPAAPVSVYQGPLAPMPDRALGNLAAGESRRYEFVATLPDGGSPPSPSGGDNAFQGASTSVRYSWIAGEEAPLPAVPPPAPPAPGGTGLPAPSVTPPSVLPSADSQFHLHLRIVRVHPSPRHGRLIVLGRCDAPCRIAGRARFGVIGPSRHFRATASRSLRRRGFAGRRQRLALIVPPRLLRLARSEASRPRSG